MASNVLDLEVLNKNAKLAELSEDLILLIRLSLPPKSIFRFRCVSKTWKNIISTPFFLQSYHPKAKDPPCLFALVAVPKNRDPCRHCKTLLPPARINHDFKIDILFCDGALGAFVNSSNGLTLWFNYSTYQCNILNPLTRKTVSLPNLIRRYYYSPYPALVCEKRTQELVASYKVIIVAANDHQIVGKSLIIYTYSSETSKWTSSTVMLKEDVRLCGPPSTVVSGAIVHWLTSYVGHLIVYDSNRGHVQLINLPVGDHGDRRIARSGSDDELWLGERAAKNVLQFWMLPNRGSDSSLTTEWILKYRFSHDDLVKGNYGMFEVPSDSCIWLEALIPGKPHTAILEIKRRFFVYNMEERKFVEEVKFHDGHSSIENVFPYMKPRCLSSYAL